MITTSVCDFARESIKNSVRDQASSHITESMCQ